MGRDAGTGTVRMDAEKSRQIFRLAQIFAAKDPKPVIPGQLGGF